MRSETFVVKGMTCAHCVGAVTEEIEKLPGVQRVEIELATGAVTIESDTPLDPAAVAGAVAQAGYLVVS